MDRSSALLALCVVACGSDRHAEEPTPPTEARDRAADIPKVTSSNLRLLLAQVASAQACERVRDTYIGLDSSEKKGLVSGNLWIRDCSMTNDGPTIRFHFEGDGWQWVAKTTESAGAEFGVRQYARFHVAVTLFGTVDLAYVPEDHVVTVWFRSTKDPTITFSPTGDIEVDEKGIWSSIVGTLAGVVSKSPSERASATVKSQGTQSFEHQLDRGLTATVNVCTGAMRTELGILEAGQMAPPATGESLAADAVVHRGGVLVFGPQQLKESDRLVAEAYGGTAHFDIACMDDAASVARAFHAGKPLPDIPTLGSADISGKQSIEVRSSRCPVAVIVRTDESSVGISYVPRPPSHTPLVDCR
ncbi:MAG: hypothetical protein AB7T06_35520 [Kofleriaceae bacterium]